MARSSEGRVLDPSRLVTVVSGLPRSGTSMMMQMLEAAGLEIASDGVRVADADNPRGYYELEAVKRIRVDDSFIGSCVGKVVKIVAPLLHFLPGDYDYQIVIMERNLREILASQREMLKRRGEAGADAKDSVMEDAYRRQAEKVKEWIVRQGNARALFVSHRSTIDDPRSTALGVLEFLSTGLEGRDDDRDRSRRDSTVDEMARLVDAELRRQSVSQGRRGKRDNALSM